MRSISVIAAWGLFGHALCDRITVVRIYSTLIRCILSSNVEFQHVTSLDYIDKDGDFVTKVANSKGNCLRLDDTLYCSHPKKLWDPNGVESTAYINSDDPIKIQIGFVHGCQNFYSAPCESTVKWSAYTRDTKFGDVWFRDDQCFWSLQKGGKKLQDHQGNYLCYKEQKKQKKCHQVIDTNPFIAPDASSVTDDGVAEYYNKICSIEDYHLSMTTEPTNNAFSQDNLLSSETPLENTAETGALQQTGSDKVPDTNSDSAAKTNILLSNDDLPGDLDPTTRRMIKRRSNSKKRRGREFSRDF